MLISLFCITTVLSIVCVQARMVRPSEGVALSSGPLIDLLNYCTAVKFYSFDAFKGRYFAITILTYCICNVWVKGHCNSKV